MCCAVPHRGRLRPHARSVEARRLAARCHRRDEALSRGSLAWELLHDLNVQRAMFYAVPPTTRTSIRACLERLHDAEEMAPAGPATDETIASLTEPAVRAPRAELPADGPSHPRRLVLELADGREDLLRCYLCGPDWIRT